MLWGNTPEQYKSEIEKILGKSENHRGSFYPTELPNLKKVTESDFWGYHSSYSWNSDSIYIGDMTLDGVRGTVRLFYIAHGYKAKSGFAVLTKYDYPNPYQVHYFTWSSCEHTFNRRNVGNCLNEYTCSKCGSSHTVDSSG